VRVQNEKLAELCASQPDRFAAFASLALQFPDLAVQQLEDGMKKYGLRGAAIGGSVAGEEFADPRFHPVWAKAEELGAVLFIHPQSTPELAKRFKGNGWLANTIGNPLDTTIALQHLIFEGTLDRFPGLKILAAHGGGYLASYAPRSDHAFFVAPANCDANIVLKKKPSEYLKQLYFDALVFKSNDEILSHHRGRNCPVHSSKIHRQCLRWVIHAGSGATGGPSDHRPIAALPMRPSERRGVPAVGAACRVSPPSAIEPLPGVA
jgi:hypothetical protein